MLDGGGTVPPLAANAAEYVGGTALELTSGIGARETAESTEAKKEAAARESAMNSGDACNQLEVEVPDVIELRRSAAGAPNIASSDKRYARRATVAAAGRQRHDTDGWRPAVNFLQMNFTPPLGAVVPESSSSFLAYTPSKVITAADGDRLTAMSSNFGKPVGTFTWNGNYYHYVVTSTLPCYPPPPERIAQDARRN